MGVSVLVPAAMVSLVTPLRREYGSPTNTLSAG
jgi:hypothetical protein